jgi:hypothetical protein
MDGKAKDKWERKVYATGNKAANDETFNSGYQTGSRGGCYTYSASGWQKEIWGSFILWTIIKTFKDVQRDALNLLAR